MLAVNPQPDDDAVIDGLRAERAAARARRRGIGSLFGRQPGPLPVHHRHLRRRHARCRAGAVLCADPPGSYVAPPRQAEVIDNAEVDERWRWRRRTARRMPRRPPACRRRQRRRRVRRLLVDGAGPVRRSAGRHAPRARSGAEARGRRRAAMAGTATGGRPSATAASAALDESCAAEGSVSLTFAGYSASGYEDPAAMLAVAAAALDARSPTRRSSTSVPRRWASARSTRWPGSGASPPSASSRRWRAPSRLRRRPLSMSCSTSKTVSGAACCRAPRSCLPPRQRRGHSQEFVAIGAV